MARKQDRKPSQNPGNNLEKNLGACPLCGRDMIAGPSVEYHHPVPKSLKGRKTVPLHAVCHRMVHKIFHERELQELAGDLHVLKSHPEMQTFIRWVRKKPETFVDQPRTRGRRPYHKPR